MIVADHPGLELLRDAPWELHLVGSRFVGVFERASDYDFLIVADTLHGGLCRWLQDNQFNPSPGTYGSDPRLLSSDIWTRDWEDWPSIDLIPVSPSEAKMRLRWFTAMRKTKDHKAGLLAKSLKAGKAWPYLWAVVAALESLGGEG
jgi:hypothetical protein